MKTAFLLVLLFGVLYTIGEDRLIQFNETYTKWMPIEEVEKFAECIGETHFMDITDFPDLHKKPNKVFPTVPDEPKHIEEVEYLLPLLSKQRIQQTIQHLSDYATRYYTSATGVTAARWLVDAYETCGQGRGDIEVISFSHTWQQPSVIARIYGKGPNAHETVIVGGHIDSTSSSTRAPGADDDASGSATVLEIFCVLAGEGFIPERTLEFHGYAAEEVGLRGSQAIVQRYLNEGIEVAGMLQLDMTGYVRPGTTRTIGVVVDFTNPALTAFVRQLVNTYTNIQWTNTQCGYACSDHGSWFRGGYPAAFVFESIFSNSNPYIHTQNDLLSLLDMDHALETAKLGLGFAVEMAYSE
jgi:leucyl aminopeptidase